MDAQVTGAQEVLDEPVMGVLVRIAVLDSSEAVVVVEDIDTLPAQTEKGGGPVQRMVEVQHSGDTLVQEHMRRVVGKRSKITRQTYKNAEVNAQWLQLISHHMHSSAGSYLRGAPWRFAQT